MVVEILDRNRVASFGECIYCGEKASETKLSDEHVVPFSLGGNAVLEDASCQDCARITGRLEGHLGRYVFLDFRTHKKIQTRRPKERPTTLKAKIRRGDRVTYPQIPVADHPFYTPFPVWPAPGIVTGSQPSIFFEWIKADLFSWIPPNIRTTLGLEADEEAKVEYPDIQFDSFIFARAIMKIAYCTAIFRYGLRGFRRLRTADAILGRYPYIPYLAGTFHELTPRPGISHVNHAVGIHFEEVGRMTLLAGNVRLFANSGTAENGPPIYRVIIGAPPIGWREREEWAQPRAVGLLPDKSRAPEY